MTIPLDDLLINLKWEEEGAQIPDRVRAQLTELAQLQAQLARTAAGGIAPIAPAPIAPGPPELRAGAGRNRFQSEWASNSEIMAAMARDAAKARGAMDDLRAGVDAVAPAAGRTSRSIGALRSAAAAATFQITGMTGEVGRLLSGFLLFSSGSFGALAAVAALGSLALAFRGATADARTNREENQRLVASIKAIGEHGTITANRIQIAQLEQQLNAPNLGQRVGAAWDWFIGPAFGGVATVEEGRERIRREIARLRGESGAAGEDFTQPQRELRRDANLSVARARARRDALDLGPRLDAGGAESAIAITERLRVLELEYQKIPPAVAREIAARERLAAELDLATDTSERLRISEEEAALRRRMVGRPAAAVTQQLRVQELLRQGMPQAVAEDVAQRERQVTDTNAGTARREFFQSPEFASMLLQQVVSARGGVSGVLGAAGGTATALAGVRGIAGTAAAGPLGWAGFGLGALGEVFGLFDNAEERRHKELVRTIQTLGKEVGLERVTVVMVGPDGHRIRKTLAELEASDAVERIPGPPGAEG